jgi:uncharacterized protein DUF4349
MYSRKIILGLGLALLLLNCKKEDGRSNESSTSAMEIATPGDTSNGFISSTAANAGKDSTRKFIRTANLKFRVKDVIKSTYDIEDITGRHGGFVTYTSLTSNVDGVTTTAVSADATLETTHYTVTNSITLRVPNTKLDATLKEIAGNIDFLDYRIIKAEDVALQVLANKLTQKRAAKNEERLTNAIDSKGKKLAETAQAEEVLLSKQEQADDAKISNLSLADQIKFSTIILELYQRESIKREVIKNNENIDEYEPGFGTKLVEALHYGWDILESFLVFLTKMWGVFLFIIVAYILYRKYENKPKK